MQTTTDITFGFSHTVSELQKQDKNRASSVFILLYFLANQTDDIQ